AGERHLASVEDDRPVGKLQGRNCILLDGDGGDAERLDLPQDALDLMHDDRCQAFIGLIEKQELEIAGKRPRNGQHLLLATGKRCSFLLAPFSTAWEMAVDAVKIPA